MSSEAGRPEGGRWLSAGQRNAPKEADRRPAHPRGTALSFTPRGLLRGRKSVPILTQTEGNKSALMPSLPALPVWQRPVPTAYSWQLVLEPRTQASLLPGSTDPSWEGWRWGAKAPCSASHPEQDQPPRASPRPLEEHCFCCWEHVVSWAPKAGVLRHALPWPRPRPNPMGAMKKESKEQSKAAGDPQSCKMAQEDLPPCTVHPCSTSPSFRLQRGLAWDPDRYRANPSSVVQWPHL